MGISPEPRVGYFPPISTAVAASRPATTSDARPPAPPRAGSSRSPSAGPRGSSPLDPQRRELLRSNEAFPEASPREQIQASGRRRGAPPSLPSAITCWAEKKERIHREAGRRGDEKSDRSFEREDVMLAASGCVDAGPAPAVRNRHPWHQARATTLRTPRSSFPLFPPLSPSVLPASPPPCGSLSLSLSLLFPLPAWQTRGARGALGSGGYLAASPSPGRACDRRIYVVAGTVPA